MEHHNTPHNEAPAKMSPKFFFLSLGTLVGLITTVTAFLNLAFEMLNAKFPDALNGSYVIGYNQYQFEGARSALAMLIIFFPVYMLLSHFWNKTIKAGLGKIDMHIQKWLVYLVLFMSAVVVAVDLVVLVQNFVAGEVTARFIMKVLVALLVAVVVAGYHLIVLWTPASDSKNATYRKRGMVMNAVISSVLVATMVALAFMVMGSPTSQRNLRLDQARLNDLQNIQGQVINYWQQKERLPATLIELADPLSGYMIPRDPESDTGAVYEYNVKGPMTFEICATFALPIPEGWQDYGKGGGVMPMYAERDMAVSYPYPGPGGVNDSWIHEAGHTCFERTIDPEIYKPYSKMQ